MYQRPQSLRVVVVLSLVILLPALLQGCSFQLREDIRLPTHFKHLQIIGASESDGLRSALKTAIEEAGGKVISASKTKLRLSNIREGRRIVAYNSERKARIYLISLKFNYNVFFNTNSNEKGRGFSKQRINLDKTFLYDANFALGKVKEEEKIRESLYTEAARLILLRLKHGQ